MKKRMKMKKYDDGGDVYDDYTTIVTDDDGEILYQKPDVTEVSPEVRRAVLSSGKGSPGVRVDDSREMRRSGPVSGSRKSADVSEDTGRGANRFASLQTRSGAGEKDEIGAYYDNSRLGRAALKKRRSEAELEQNAKNTQRLAELGLIALPTAKVAQGILGASKAASRLKSMGQLEKALELTPKEAAMAERIRRRQEMFGSGRAASEFAKAGGIKRGGRVKRHSSGGSVKSSASRRADGIAQRGKTKGRLV